MAITKKIQENKGRTIQALIFESYHEYINSGYPKDPNIYVIRADPTTAKMLIKSSDSLMFVFGSPATQNDKPCFGRYMGFRVEKDVDLKEKTILFGPETIKLKWSK